MRTMSSVCSCTIHVFVLLVVSAIAPAALAESGDLEKAGELLSPTGKYVAYVGWGYFAGSPADGLVVAEPAALTEFRAARNADPSVREAANPAVRRLLNLSDSWDRLDKNPAFREALAALAVRTRELTAEGRDGATAAMAITQNDPALASRLTFNEMPTGRGGAADDFPVRDLTCFDTDNHVVTRIPLKCAKGGNGCWVQVPCPTGGASHIAPTMTTHIARD